ncbi:hypothetical protein [Phenylobacterium sp.]|uniref:ATP-grasp domain-containing protein n=1 Tax=Phenylobacterium sp. TaxID=1871053 RepID=UPI0030F414CC
MSDHIPRVGFIVGNDFDRIIQFDQAGIVNVEGNNDADRVLALLPEGGFNKTRIHLAPSYFRKAHRWATSGIDILWNMVSDADMNPATLAVVDKFTAELGIPVIDPARAILQTRRHHIASRLAGLDNVHMPKTLLLRNPTLERVKRQVDQVGFRFPAILRRTGSHNGQFIGLFDTPEQIEGIYGDRHHEYYMTEFVDYRWADGLYRKARFFFVGDEIVIRQLIIAPEWNIHGRSGRWMASQPALEAEGAAMLAGGVAALPDVTRIALRSIADKIGLDYFGLDASLDADGRLTIFEANATMNFVPRNGQMRARSLASVPPMVASVRKLLLRKVFSGR